MYHIKNIRDEYDNSAAFHAVVNCLYGIIHDAQLTPEELRKALFYASYKYEIDHIKPIFISTPPAEKE